MGKDKHFKIEENRNRRAKTRGAAGLLIVAELTLALDASAYRSPY